MSDVIVGISGASGAVYGIRTLELLRALGVTTHLVVSRSAGLTLASETDRSLQQLEALASHNYKYADIGARISSGSFKSLGMIVAPCSTKTLAEIATGITGNLISRAADVVLKERRRLILLVRETPLHLGHLRNMVAATESGAIICPPVPAFYANPTSLAEMVDHTVGRALDLFGLETHTVKRWDGLAGKPDAPSAPRAPPEPN